MKKVKGFNNYFIDCRGNIYSDYSGVLLEMTPQINRDGYKVINLLLDGKSYHRRINRLVAEAFVTNPRPGEFYVVHHKDDDRLNNYYKNLEWCTANMNNDYKVAADRHARGTTSGLAKLTDEQVIEIYQRLLEGAPLKISKDYGISERAVSRIKDKTTWGHILKDFPDIPIRERKEVCSSDTVEQICSLLEKGCRQKDVCELLGVDKQIVSAIYRRVRFVNISSKYNW